MADVYHNAWHNAFYNGGIIMLLNLLTFLTRVIQIFAVGLLILGDRLISRRLKEICESDELKNDTDIREATSDRLVRRYNMKYTLCGYVAYVTYIDLASQPLSEMDVYRLAESAIWITLIGLLPLLALRKWSKGVIMRFFFLGFPRLVYLLVCICPNQVFEQLCAKYYENTQTPLS